MSRSDYRVPNGPFVSTSTVGVDDYKGTKRKWNIKDIYSTEFTLDSLVRTLDVIDIFKRKYPNDETVQDFEDIVRDEICRLFGGSILNFE